MRALMKDEIVQISGGVALPTSLSNLPRSILPVAIGGALGAGAYLGFSATSGCDVTLAGFGGAIAAGMAISAAASITPVIAGFGLAGATAFAAGGGFGFGGFSCSPGGPAGPGRGSNSMGSGGASY